MSYFSFTWVSFHKGIFTFTKVLLDNLYNTSNSITIGEESKLRVSGCFCGLHLLVDIPLDLKQNTQGGVLNELVWMIKKKKTYNGLALNCMCPT